MTARALSSAASCADEQPSMRIEHDAALQRGGRVSFEAESTEAAGAELRRLAVAAWTVGFELERGRVEPRPADANEGDRPTPYGPLDEPSA
jgi:hypothetical protein